MLQSKDSRAVNALITNARVALVLGKTAKEIRLLNYWQKDVSHLTHKLFARRMKSKLESLEATTPLEKKAVLREYIGDFTKYV